MPASHRHPHPRAPAPPLGALFHELSHETSNKQRRQNSLVLDDDENQPTQATKAIPTEIDQPTQTKALDGPLATASGVAAPKEPLAGDGTATRALTVPSNTSTSEPSTATEQAAVGMSPGATAGIAFGVLGGVLVIGLLLYYIFNRQRKKSKGAILVDADGEKFDMSPSAGATPMVIRSNPKAPRLSLRPVTQFFPGFNTEKRGSKSAAMALSAAASRGPPGGVPFERPSTSQSTHPSNPFGSGAQRVPSPVQEERKQLPPTPVENASASRGAPIATTTITRKASLRAPGPLNTSMQPPPSPAGTEWSMNMFSPGAATSTAASGPKYTTVHRVQLDFKPTLEDEMEINAGDLVRLLHEYDDGWALCIRLDKSQQGVVPRTCLSTRAIKPRNPQGDSVSRPGPPISPQGRPMTPQGMGRPESPARPRTANGPAPLSPGGRPQSPRSPAGRPGSRGQSPGPRHQGPISGRSQSPSGLSRQMGAPGPSPMNPHSRDAARSPLPGQAM